MLPLFQYLVSILLWAPAVLHVAFKRPLSYESILSLLLISSALNVVIGMKTFGKGYGVARIGKALSAWAAGTVIFHCVAVLLGAHFMQAFERTLIWAAWMSSMVAIPLGMILGMHPAAWFDLVLKREHDGSPQMQRLLCDIYSILFGAWVSCIVIPLDWGRPWQAWPIPNVIGTAVLMTTTAVGMCIKSILRGGSTMVSTGTRASPTRPTRDAANAKASVTQSASKSPAKSHTRHRTTTSGESPVRRTRSVSRSPVKKPTRSPSKSPTKKGAAAATIAPSTPRAARSRSKMATPASTRTSSRLRRA